MIWPSRSKSNTYSPAPAFFAPGVRAASRFMRVSSDPVPRAADDALDADDLGVLEHRQAVREVGWNVDCLARADVEDLGAEREPGFPLQQEQDLLLRMRMLLRAFAGLVAQDAKLDSLASDQAAKGARMLRRDELFLQLLDVVDGHLLGQGEIERPGGEDLVFLEQCTAHRVAARVALLQAFEAAVPAGGACIERQDRVAGEDEAAAQRAERGMGRAPVRRARARRERLDVVAVLVYPCRLAAQPQDGLEEPLAVRVLHRIFPGHHKFAAAGVAVFPLGAPTAFLKKESVVYPCTFTLSAGASRRSSMV